MCGSAWAVHIKQQTALMLLAVARKCTGYISRASNKIDFGGKISLIFTERTSLVPNIILSAARMHPGASKQNLLFFVENTTRNVGTNTRHFDSPQTHSLAAGSRKLTFCFQMLHVLRSPNSFARKWCSHFLIQWALPISIYKAAREFNWLLCVCSNIGRKNRLEYVSTNIRIITGK